MVVGTLLNACAYADVCDEEGFTPLHRAARYNDNHLVIKALLDAGADAKVKSSKGVLPIDIASENPRIRDSKAYRRLKDLSYD